jgi:hypothetical protein
MHTANSIPLMKVASSQISAIGHDAASETLAIQFFHKCQPGNVYHYRNFSVAEYTAFAGAESIGRHFKLHVKPHAEKHPYQNMGVPAPASDTAAEQQQEQAA